MKVRSEQIVDSLLGLYAVRRGAVDFLKQKRSDNEKVREGILALIDELNADIRQTLDLMRETESYLEVTTDERG